MRVLSKKVAVLAAVYILAVLLFAGCDSGIQDSSEVTSLEINGWMLTSPEGDEAIKTYSASEVEAVKTLEFDGKLYVCTIKGNAVSVLDRVRDPLFGCADVNYEDPVVKDYLKSFTSKSVTDVENMHISIQMTPVEGAVSNSRYTYPQYWQLSPGMPTFPFGILCSYIKCAVTPQSPNMQFAVYYECRDQYNLGGWKSAGGSNQIFSGMGTVQVNSSFWFGWWQWRMGFSVSSGGTAFFGFDWAGSVPKKN